MILYSNHKSKGCYALLLVASIIKSIKKAGIPVISEIEFAARFTKAKMICVTGVSGSGKSTLINETLYPILNNHIYRGVKKPMPYKSIKGLEHIDKVIDINQSPIGRTPRSNPATYTGLFTFIRDLSFERHKKFNSH